MPTNILQLILSEVKHHANRKKDAMMQDIVHKITVLAYTLILVFVLALFGIMTVFFLSFTLAYALEPYLGGLIYSFALITGIILLIGGILYVLRKKLILQPISRFLTDLFRKEEEETSGITLGSGLTAVWGIIGGIKIARKMMRLFR